MKKKKIFIFRQVNLGLKYKVGGFMIWSIDTDDFHGDCDKERLKVKESGQDKYTFPLLRAVHTAIQEYKLQDDDNNDIPEVGTNDVDEPKENNVVPSFQPSITANFVVIFTSGSFLLILNYIVKQMEASHCRAHTHTHK